MNDADSREFEREFEDLAVLEAGLPYRRYETLVASLGLPARRLNRLLGFSARTLGRRQRQGFTLHESDRLYRLERVWGQAVGVFGDVGAARGWLDTPKQRLGGRAPLELIATDAGGRLVEKMLAGIEVRGEP